MDYLIRVIKRHANQHLNTTGIVEVFTYKASKRKIVELIEDRERAGDFNKLADIYKKDAIDIEVLKTFLSDMLTPNVPMVQAGNTKVRKTDELIKEFRQFIDDNFNSVVYVNEAGHVAISQNMTCSPEKLLELTPFKGYIGRIPCDAQLYRTSLKYNELIEKINSDQEFTIDDFLMAIEVLNFDISKPYTYSLEKILE